jgi:hypothetical protein
VGAEGHPVSHKRVKLPLLNVTEVLIGQSNGASFSCGGSFSKDSK